MLHRRKIILFILLSCSLICISACDTQLKHANAEDHYISVQLLGFNDLHGQLEVYRTVMGKRVGGAEYVASYIKKYEQENENTLLLHVGDSVGASAPVSSLHQDEPTIELLNRVGFDVGTVGNHGFDEGYDELKRLLFGGSHENTGYFEGADFPHTVANVIDKETGNSILPPYVIKKVSGIPIGFIGVVTTETTKFVLPDGIKGLVFTDEVTAINEAAEELKEKGVKAIVVLAHNSVSTKKDGSHPSGDVAEFVQRVDDEIDIIYGAHNHTYANTIIDQKLIVQSYSNGTAFSDVDIKIDPETQDIVEKKAEIVRTYHKGMEPDAEIKEMVDSYREPVDSYIHKVIGLTSRKLTRKQNKSGESELGNVIADSLRNEMETDLAFVYPGGIRANLDKGEITWGEVYTVFPFDFRLVKMKMTGEQIKAVLEEQWMGGEPRILQISGLHYTWDDNAPIGERIMEVMDEYGHPIDHNQMYTVTMNEFLAGGGDGFSVFQEGTNIMDGPTELDALTRYIQGHEGDIQVPSLNRINVNTFIK
jgi:5'-nucleotidase